MMYSKGGVVMRRWGIVVGLLCFSLGGLAQDLEYHKIYTPQEGMDADQIMRIKYHNKYSLFAYDYESTGDVIFIERDGTERHRKFLRQRLVLGRVEDDISYKDLVMFTNPTIVKGMATLTWNYITPEREQDVWLWLPSLKKIRKVSAAQAEDSFMGGDLTVEEVSSRRFDDETYTLLREENFKGYKSFYDGKVFHEGEPCFVIEARPKRKHWYYSKRLVWVSKNFGGNIYDEVYDRGGRLRRTILRAWKIMDVNGRAYPAQIRIEAADLRTQHKTVVLIKDIKFDQGLSEARFTQKTLMRSKW
jgi:hypothetical protein